MSEALASPFAKYSHYSAWLLNILIAVLLTEILSPQGSFSILILASLLILFCYSPYSFLALFVLWLRVPQVYNPITYFFVGFWVLMFLVQEREQRKLATQFNAEQKKIKNENQESFPIP